MASVFNIMAAISSQINILSDYYSDNEGVSIRTLPHLPNFIVVSVNRAMDTMPWIVKDPAKATNVNITTILDTGDPYNPVYLCVVDNINKAIVDKVPLMINHKGNRRPGSGYVVAIPIGIFEDDVDVTNIASLFKDLYFSLLDFDKEMTYKAEPAIIRLYNSSKVRVYTYDLTMILVALCLTHHNMRHMFVMDPSREPLDSIFTMQCFTDEELSKDLKESVAYVLDNYSTSVDKLRDGVGSGKLLKMLLYRE